MSHAPGHARTHASADTIVAASSAPGRSPRGLVRLSGPDCLDILTALGIDPPPPRRLATVHLDLPPRMPALLTRFAAPASYTAQDMAELQVVGHPALLERVIRRCVTVGARPAEPGEFTFRAFLAGKLDLTQAEGIAATIAAQSDGELQAASMLRLGELGRFAQRWVDSLANTLALVESGIDFTDQEDVVPIAPAALAERLQRAWAELSALLARSRAWGALEALPRVVLLGAPSTGKSTLFNALLGRRRAVVSEQAGTTRDILAEPLTLPGDHGRNVELMLLDIAGLDTPRGALDRAVQEAARLAIDAADLLVTIYDGTHDAPRVPPGKATLCVRTKCEEPPAPRGDDLAVSAHQRIGLDILKQRIAASVGERGTSLQSDLLALQPRHQSALRNAQDALHQAIEWVQPQTASASLQQVELIAAALRQALDEMASLGGQMTPDDILGRVFATFCVGK